MYVYDTWALLFKLKLSIIIYFSLFFIKLFWLKKSWCQVNIRFCKKKLIKNRISWFVRFVFYKIIILKKKVWYYVNIWFYEKNLFLLFVDVLFI